MKSILIKLIILILLSTYNVQSQEVKVVYDRTDIDTSDVVNQTIKLRIDNFPNNTNRCELIDAYATDETHHKIKPEYFLTQANSEFWITFIKSKKSKKIISLNGKARFFSISEEAETIIKIDSILEKVNKTIYSKNEIKIIVVDIEALKNKKGQNLFEYKKEVARIVKENKLNQKRFENTLKKTFENYNDLFNMMIYCEDSKNSIEDIDSLFTEYNKYPEGIKNDCIKTFLFSKSDASNLARISIKDSLTYKEIDFNVVIDDD
ncbi:hypothetical protein [Flavobacterium sp. N2820]|jgi:hypothetical protein|uniref:hypothetical protein n=1 Tax=Flavobacterium sp. N2820 TaxID=2986834 RepID=UPI002225216B|nr:hypothetical protein [Flavobacterium sp. N2820]